MKFVIKHEIKGRIRIHILQSRMTFEQADTLEYYLSNNKLVTSVKVRERLQDATISYINLSSGQVVIKYNDVVKKGDLIATSNLQYLDNLYSRDKMVPLVGEILGNVKEYYEIEVLKNEEVEFFNGNKQQFYTLDFSKKILFSKKNPYENYFITKYTLFKIGKFQVVKNIIYEKDTASVIRTKKEAQDYALIQIYQDYEANRTSKKEKIDSIQLINFIEYEDRYYFKFIVSACKNIVEFKPF